MKKQFFLGLMLATSIQAFADQTPAEEVAIRSGFSLSHVQKMLVKCASYDRTAEDMYFCAYRDLIVAERKLQKIVNQQNSHHPEHKAVLDARIAQRKKAIAEDCRKTAHRGWADQSLESVVALFCQEEQTQGMVKTMREGHTADQAPTQEVAKHSGLPLNVIQKMLAKCDKVNETTQDMYFCAWRDLAEAELDLQKIANQRSNLHPKRKAVLNARIEHWKKARAKHCQKAANHELGGGSLEPAEAMACQAGETLNMVKVMRKDRTAIPCKNSVRVCHDALTR
jgi:DNA-binding transcriptional MerR regulator